MNANLQRKIALSLTIAIGAATGIYSVTTYASNVELSQPSDNRARENRVYDLRFIEELADHHRTGIEMAKLAAAKGMHRELRKMAEKMVKDQQSGIQKLLGWRQQYFMNVPRLQKRSVGMNMAKLQALSGNAFDLAFLDSMIMHHPAAIYLGLEANQRATQKEIGDFGQESANKQLNELDKMRTWREEWAGH